MLLRNDNQVGPAIARQRHQFGEIGQRLGGDAQVHIAGDDLLRDLVR